MDEKTLEKVSRAIAEALLSGSADGAYHAPVWVKDCEGGEIQIDGTIKVEVLARAALASLSDSSEEAVTPEKIPQRLLDALDECIGYDRTGRFFKWRLASMRKLEEMGLVETWKPSKWQWKQLPYRPTEAGHDVASKAFGVDTRVDPRFST